jgi:outer membrane protein
MSWLAILLLAQQPSAPQPLTLDEAITKALANNPRVDAAGLSALATGETVRQVRSAYSPTVSALGSAAAAPDDVRLGAGGLNNPIVFSRVGLGLAVNQLITDFGRTGQLAQAASARTLAEQDVTRSTRGAVVLQVQQAYLAGLRAQATMRVAQETVATRQTTLDQISTLASNQLKSELDVRIAQVGVSEAKLLLSAATNDRQAADADLSAAMGLAVPQHFVLSTPAASTPTLLALEELMKVAAQDNPEVAQRRHLLEAALRMAEAERKARLPSISAVAAAGVVPAHAERFSRDTYAAAGVNITLPMLNGKLIESRRTEAGLRALAAKRTLEEAESRVARNIAVTLLAIDNAAERLALAQELLARARQALELAQLRYDLGLASFVEFSQVQLTVVNAEIQVETTRYDAQLQRAVLAFHLGTTP